VCHTVFFLGKRLRVETTVKHKRTLLFFLSIVRIILRKSYWSTDWGGFNNFFEVFSIFLVLLVSRAWGGGWSFWGLVIKQKLNFQKKPTKFEATEKADLRWACECKLIMGKCSRKIWSIGWFFCHLLPQKGLIQLNAVCVLMTFGF
jgi:hypothetical protein